MAVGEEEKWIGGGGGVNFRWNGLLCSSRRHAWLVFKIFLLAQRTEIVQLH